MIWSSSSRCTWPARAEERRLRGDEDVVVVAVHGRARSCAAGRPRAPSGGSRGPSSSAAVLARPRWGRRSRRSRRRGRTARRRRPVARTCTPSPSMKRTSTPPSVNPAGRYVHRCPSANGRSGERGLARAVQPVVEEPVEVVAQTPARPWPRTEPSCRCVAAFGSPAMDEREEVVGADGQAKGLDRHRPTLVDDAGVEQVSRCGRAARPRRPRTAMPARWRRRASESDRRARPGWFSPATATRRRSRSPR